MSSMSFLSSLFSSDSDSEPQAAATATGGVQGAYGNSFTQTLLDTLGGTKDILFPLVNAADQGFGPIGNGISAIHGVGDMHAKGKDLDDAIAHQASKFGASFVPMGPGAEGIDAGLKEPGPPAAWVVSQ